ncbi:MAG TPA: hypothetical protein PKJ78_18220 [Candidatus Hydrogenedentes bacterium]|nr:hypothetical protein [Candidatus Hydrogenedentota bacterium]
MNPAEKQSNAHVAAKIRFRQYREQMSKFKVFDDFEACMKQTEKRVSDGDSEHEVFILTYRLWHVSRNYFFLLRVIEHKFDRLLQAMEDVLEKENALSLALHTRSLVEHLGALALQFKFSERLLNGLRGQSNRKQIESALARAEDEQKRLYFGVGAKSSESEVKAFHVNDLLEAARAWVGDMDDVYAYLCEYVHPNHGSNLLVSSGELGGGRLAPSEEASAEALSRMCGYAILGVDLLEELSKKFGVHLVYYAHFINLGLREETKLANWFQERGVKITGDGKSKDTAICFVRARNAFEAIQMQQRYMKMNGIVPLGNRFLGGVEGEHIYDVYPTAEGELWFKVPRVEELP